MEFLINDFVLLRLHDNDRISQTSRTNRQVTVVLGKVRFSLLGRWIIWMLWLISLVAGWAVCLWNTWGCHLVHRSRQLLFGIPFWRRWRRNYQDGNTFIYPRVVCSLYWRAFFLAFLLIFLSLFTIPMAVAARLERIQRNFLWGSSEGSFQYPLVAWDKVCSPIEMGGLGIRNVVSFNQALLEKWLWRYGHEVTHFW